MRLERVSPKITSHRAITKLFLKWRPCLQDIINSTAKSLNSRKVAVHVFTCMNVKENFEIVASESKRIQEN